MLSGCITAPFPSTSCYAGTRPGSISQNYPYDSISGGLSWTTLSDGSIYTGSRFLLQITFASSNPGTATWVCAVDIGGSWLSSNHYTLTWTGTTATFSVLQCDREGALTAACTAPPTPVWEAGTTLSPVTSGAIAYIYMSINIDMTVPKQTGTTWNNLSSYKHSAHALLDSVYTASAGCSSQTTGCYNANNEVTAASLAVMFTVSGLSNPAAGLTLTVKSGIIDDASRNKVGTWRLVHVIRDAGSQTLPSLDS